VLPLFAGCGGGGAANTTTPTGTLSITSASLLTGTASASYSATLATTGGTAPYTWSVQSGTLPLGIVLNSSGSLSGTPTAIGNTAVTLQVADSSTTRQTATQQVSLDIIPAGFTTTPSLDEEFTGSALNTSLWGYRTGVRDQCTQDQSAVSVANGYLRLTTYTTTSGSTQTNYCGAISTASSYTHAYGYWEAAVRYNYQTGAQSAWWIQSPTIGKDLTNPQASGVEMDIFEHTSGNTSTTGYDHALHWNGYTAGIAQSLAVNGTLASLNDGKFHIFGIAWTPSGYTFYVDGQITWTLTSSQAPASSAAEYIILDTELPPSAKVPTGGYGAIGASGNPYLDVDYVRVYPYSAQ
jgi:beta-glucanase (GH16 family)